MANGVNEVFLIGNVGNDPELRETNSGAKVVNFSLATTESRKNKEGERIDTTQWHRIVAWGNTADAVAKYVGKGSQVFVNGTIQYRKYDKDGTTMYQTDIVANNIQFLGGKNTKNDLDDILDSI